MNLSALLKASHAYGGPYKLLLLNLRGGQFIGTILALSCYAWLMSVLASHHLVIASSNKAIIGLGTYLSIYILASMPAIWLYLEKVWFEWASMSGDLLGVAGSIAIAVLTRGSTSACSGLFLAGEEAQVGVHNAQQACKLQKVVFATGICNSLMFFVTFLLFAALRNGLLNRDVGKEAKEEGVHRNRDVEKSSVSENVDRT